jgi:hypothetical protein
MQNTYPNARDRGKAMRVSRRGFLQTGGSLVLAGIHADLPVIAAGGATELRIGLVTDLHCGDKPTSGSRHYRETPAKLAEAAEKLTDERIDLLVALGDLIDSSDSITTERRTLERIHKQLAAIGVEQHFVLGNHCVDQLRKEEFLGVIGQDRSWYSFARDGFHFVILDSCFRTDGEPYGRRNFDCAVFQGHSHHNALQEIAGIRYCTLAAMVEGQGPEANAYGLLRLAGDGSIRVHGFRQQHGYHWQD